MDQLEQKISDVITRCDADVEGIAAKSQSRAKLGLGSGERVPDYRRFDAVGDYAAARMRARIDVAYDEICNIIDADYARVSRTMSAPASADDVATVQFALSRDDLTADELRALHGRYSSNYQLAKAIEGRAFKDGVDVPLTVITADADAAKLAARSLYSRYDDGFLGIPLGRCIADSYHHRDVFGELY